MQAELSEDEAYLVEIYRNIADARNQHPVNYLKSESLFTMLDSTIDTLRIANTIQELNDAPDRWILILQTIEQGKRNTSQGGN